MPPGATVAARRLARELDQVAVLAGVMARDGSELSATETLEQRTGPRRPPRRARRDLGRPGPPGAARPVRACAPRRAACRPRRARLWAIRRVRGCGARCAKPRPAGSTAVRSCGEAIEARSMTGARDVARVHRLPRPAPARRTPAAAARPVGRPRAGHRSGRHHAGICANLPRRWMTGLRRLGEHAALTQPLWARQALGPLPADPAGRLDWEHRAGVIAAYRERYGHDHPADPIGPEPRHDQPGGPGRLARRARRARPDRRNRPASPLRWRTVAAARNLRTRDRLGAAACRGGPQDRPHRRAGRPRQRHPRRARDPGRASS